MSKYPTIIPEFQVSNFKQSLNFYTQLAKFKILYQRLEDNFAMLEINGGQLMIEQAIPPNRSWHASSIQKPYGEGMHLQIQVDNVEYHYQNFIKVNYPIFYSVEEKWYRVNASQIGHKQFLVQDPDGYLLRFFQVL